MEVETVQESRFNLILPMIFNVITSVTPLSSTAATLIYATPAATPLTTPHSETSTNASLPSARVKARF